MEDEARPKLKVNPRKNVSDDPSFALSKTPGNVLHSEGVSNYLRSKFEKIGDDHISMEFDNIYNQDMSYKKGFEHLKEKDIVKFLFYYEFDNEKWTRIMLSRIHDGKFWLGDNVIQFFANLIHEVTRLCNEGSILVNEKNVNKLVDDNTKSVYNGRGIVIRKIKQRHVRFLSRIIVARMCYSLEKMT